MMKTVLLENELYNGAMTDLLEMRDVMKNEYIDKGQKLTDAKYIYRSITAILNEFNEAASIAGHSAMENAKFEIMNVDPETFMEIEYGDESES